MTITLEKFFNTPIYEFGYDLSLEEVIAYLGHKESSFYMQRSRQVRLAVLLNKKKYFSPEDSKIINTGHWLDIMISNPYERGLQYLRDYEKDFMDFDSLTYPNTFPRKYQDNPLMASVFVSSKICDGSYTELLDSFLQALERGILENGWLICYY